MPSRRQQNLSIIAYIVAVEEFVPALLELGYTLGDVSPATATIHLAGNGLETYVSMEDTALLESLVDPELHRERLEPPEPEMD
ncbi:MAG TPA: hypothetical protein VGK41_00990 [Solirubrobacterales bacterium]